MSNKDIQTLDEVLETEIKEEQEVKKSNKKGKLLAILAAIAAGVIAVTSIIVSVVKKNNNTNGSSNENTSTTTTAFDLDNMGDELTTNTTTITYKVVSGNIDPNKIVEQDGKLYKDATEASEAQNKTTSIDLKNDTLKTSVVKDKNGKTTIKVYDKTTGYEIKDKDTKTTATGNLKDDGIPDGYAYDSVLKKYVKKEEVGKYVYADSNYYNEEGTLVIKKGSVVSKETLEYAKKYLSKTAVTTTSKQTTTKATTKATTSTTAKSTTTTTTTSNQGKVNKDGTYTIYGLTFETKADYQQWVIQGYEGYVEADGIMISEEELNKRIQKSK